MQLAKSSAVEVFTVGASALTKGQHVKLTAGLLVVAGAADTGIGVMLDDADAGADASVALFGGGEVVHLEAHDNATVAGETLIPAAAGRFDSGTTSGRRVAVALEDSTAQGHLIKAVLSPPAA